MYDFGYAVPIWAYASLTWAQMFIHGIWVYKWISSASFAMGTGHGFTGFPQSWGNFSVTNSIFLWLKGHICWNLIIHLDTVLLMTLLKTKQVVK